MEPAWNKLPIAPLLPALASALSDGGALVLQAETGAGKTTAVPAYLASRMTRPSLAGACLADATGHIKGAAPAQAKSIQGRIIVLEPRRLAAVAAAHRVAALLGEEPGGLVGYRIRGAVKAGPRTRVEFVTQAIFLRMIQEDPFIQDIVLVIFDEFHERTSIADLSLAFALEAREARPGLSILVMSATMDTEKVATFLGCSEMSAPGRAWPVAVRYQPPLAGERIEGATARAIESALEAGSGDILAFLPGLRELRRVAGILAERGIGGRGSSSRSRRDSESLHDFEVLLLHGSLALEDQRRVINPGTVNSRRIILATNVAETSLTVPGVTAVVDSGLSRFMGWHPRSGLNRLETGPVSKAEAEQRRGRAGRLGPGLCIRCWDEGTVLPESRGPELSRSELAALVLECAARGIRRPEDLSWLDTPPKSSWEAGASLLADLGLTQRPPEEMREGSETGLRESAGSITESGRRVLSLGVDPRAGAALVLAARGSGLAGGPESATALPGKPGATGRKPLVPPGTRAAAHTTVLACAVVSERDPDDFGEDGDFCSRLRRVLDGPGNDRIQAIRSEADRLAGRLGLGGFDPALARQALEYAGELLAPGFPDRLARSLPDGTFEFRSGRRARAVADLPRSDWILALDVDAGDPLGTIRQGAALSTEAAHKALAPGAREATELEWRGLRAAAFERLRAGCFLLAERRLSMPSREALAAAVKEKLRREGLSWLPWNEASSAFLARLRYALRLGELDPLPRFGKPPLDDGTVSRGLEESLVPYLNTRGEVLDEAALIHALEDMLEPAALRTLNRIAPAFVDTPGGRRRRPAYPSAGPARLAMRIQEAFGLKEAPRICGQALVIELLSPADRPIQVTPDLTSFWANTYPSVRVELKRRYPKHYWPEDPLSAEPTRGLKPR